jgi:8-oxo-dGTP pyrophosphatase MutT (NUDIX family)
MYKERHGGSDMQIHSIVLRMQYTIYFGSKPLVISNENTKAIHEVRQNPATVFIEAFDRASVAGLLREIQAEKTTAAVILHPEPGDVLQALKDEMQLIVAGGGLVYTDNQTILLIYRKGKWDLPKGKLDDGETPAVAAVREVQEETGVEHLELGEPLTVTYHTYFEKGRLVLKESHWFGMKSPEQPSLVPQQDEDIEQCIWVKWNDLDKYLQNTHPSIVDVLKAGIEQLRDLKAH